MSFFCLETIVIVVELHLGLGNSACARDSSSRKQCAERHEDRTPTFDRWWCLSLVFERTL